VKSIAPAHAPSNGSDASGVDILLRTQISRRGQQVATGTVFRYAAHNLVSLVRSSCYFAAVEVDGECDISLVSQLRGLFLYPVVESPVLVDHDQRGERAFALRRVQQSVHRLGAALVGNGLAVSREGSSC